MIFLLSCLAFLCQEMVLASVSDVKGMSHENLDDILDIPGMEIDHDDLYFKGQKVKSINGFGGDTKEEPDLPEESIETPELFKAFSEEEGEPGSYRDYRRKKIPRGYGKYRYDNDILDNVKSVTPIKNIQELKSIQEIKSMLPVKSIQEIKSIKEIESIEEIKDKVARSFIRNHGLKNLINDEGWDPEEYKRFPNNPDTTDLDNLRVQITKDTKQCEFLKEKVEKRLQEVAIMEEIEDKHCQAAKEETKEYKTLKEKIEAALDGTVASIEPIKNIEEVKSITPIKNIDEIESMTSVESIQEVKSITPIESIQEVKHMYELTEAQAQMLRDLVNGKIYPSNYRSRGRK